MSRQKLENVAFLVLKWVSLKKCPVLHCLGMPPAQDMSHCPIEVIYVLIFLLPAGSQNGHFYTTQSGKKLTSVLTASFEKLKKITLMSQVYETMLKLTNYNPICTITFCRIFIQSFDDF